MPVKGGGLPPWLTPGNKGNKGGNHRSGKRSNSVRAACQKGAAEAVPILKKILKSPSAELKDKIRAAEVLGRWAGVEVKQVDAQISGDIRVVWE